MIRSPDTDSDFFAPRNPPSRVARQFVKTCCKSDSAKSVEQPWTAAQRRQAFRALALAEAAAPSGDDAEGADWAGASTGIAEERPKDPPARGASASSRGRGMFANVANARFAQGGCPHCRSPEVGPCGSARGLPRYRCAQCRKTFNAFTGTPVAGLHNKDRWLDQAQALIEGESLASLDGLGMRSGRAMSDRSQHRLLDGGIGFSPLSTSTSPSAFPVLSKPMRPIMAAAGTGPHHYDSP